MSKNIYVVITQTGTSVSSLLKLFTKEPYNHSSIAFDREMTQMYSFARRVVWTPLIAGFIIEDPDTRVYRRFPQTTCRVYEIETTDEKYAKALKIVSSFMDEYSRYKYDGIGLFLHLIKKTWVRPYRYTCSQFVSYVLTQSGIYQFDKQPPEIHPMDFTEIQDSKLIYEGVLRNYPYAKFAPL